MKPEFLGQGRSCHSGEHSFSGEVGFGPFSSEFRIARVTERARFAPVRVIARKRRAHEVKIYFYFSVLHQARHHSKIQSLRILKLFA